jgi:hypothetical protein
MIPCLGSHISPPRFPAAAVKAIQKVEKVRTARQDRFYETRMSTAKATQAGAERKQLEQQIHLVKAPGALAREREAKLKGEGLAWGAGSGGGGGSGGAWADCGVAGGL